MGGLDAGTISVAASAAGAFVAGFLSGRRVQRELDHLGEYLAHALHPWLLELAARVGHRPPPAVPTSRKGKA